MAYETSSARWLAVAQRDKAADNIFVYSVKTTGIYCRPTCPARLARRANVDFYPTPSEAEAAGFRPCKRCKPEAARDGDDQDVTVRKACDVLARFVKEHAGERVKSEEGAGSTKTMGLKELASAVGKTPRYLHKIFKDRMGVTPKQYAMQLQQLYSPTTMASSQDTTAMHSGNILESTFDFSDFDFDFDFGTAGRLGCHQTESSSDGTGIIGPFAETSLSHDEPSPSMSTGFPPTPTNDPSGVQPFLALPHELALSSQADMAHLLDSAHDGFFAIDALAPIHLENFTLTGVPLETSNCESTTMRTLLGNWEALDVSHLTAF